MFVSLESPDLVDVVLHHLRSVELHVPVCARALSKQLVVVLILVIASLKCQLSTQLEMERGKAHLQHHEMLPLLIGEFCVVLLLNGEL